MTGHVLPLNASEHAAVDTLLPWYVNGTLQGGELERVERHIEACEHCREEIVWLRDVFAACTLLAPVPDTPAPRLAAGIASLDARANPSTWRGRASANWQATLPWMRMLIAAQFAGLAILGTLLAFDSQHEPGYRTLGGSMRPASAADTIAVMFDPAITEAELRQVVTVAGARIVNGPTATHAFVLEVPAARSAEAVRKLRAEPMVRFAEPLGPPPDR